MMDVELVELLSRALRTEVRTLSDTARQTSWLTIGGITNKISLLYTE